MQQRLPFKMALVGAAFVGVTTAFLVWPLSDRAGHAGGPSWAARARVPGGTSDDFAGPSLAPAWQIEGPDGVLGVTATEGSDAFLRLSTPGGNSDAWETNNAARAMQSVADEDLEFVARFLSTPAERYQMQGFLVEADADHWLRFDTYSDGEELYAFGAVTEDGASTAHFNVVLPVDEAPYLRLTRTGDEWRFDWSADGTDWTTAGTVTHDIPIAAAGVFAGSRVTPSGYTARVDYFENSAAPLTDEDASLEPENAGPAAETDG